MTTQGEKNHMHSQIHILGEKQRADLPTSFISSKFEGEQWQRSLQ